MPTQEPPRAGEDRIDKLSAAHEGDAPRERRSLTRQRIDLAQKHTDREFFSMQNIRALKSTEAPGDHELLEMLLALGQHLANGHDLKSVRQYTVTCARQLVDATTMLLPLVDADRQHFTNDCASGTNAASILNRSFPLSAGITGWMLSSKKPLLSGKDQPLLCKKLEWEENVESILAIPLTARNRVIGGLVALGKANGHGFTQQDLDRLVIFANHASNMIESARVVTGYKEQNDLLKASVERLQREKELAETILNSIIDPVIVTDVDAKVVKLNEGAHALLDTGQTNTLGKPITHLIRFLRNDRPVPDLVSTALEQNWLIRIEQMADEAISDKGYQFPVEGSVAVLRDEENRTTGAVMVFRDVTEQRRRAERLHKHATYDQLTNLINRQEFERRLEKALASTREHGHQYTLCFLDLDQFKTVNDTAGHTAGDELLRQLGAVLGQQIRARDTLARIGGDEFALLLEHCPIACGVKIAEQVRQTVEDFSFLWDGKPYRIGVSIGVVPVDAVTRKITDLLATADRACYAAKAHGRNRIHIYSESDEELLSRHREMRWISRLHDALVDDQLTLFFQPIMSLSDEDNGDCHYELLLRLRDIDGSLLPPGAFIPAAERHGLMTEIDRWVINHYADWLLQHPEHLEILSLVSINLSGLSLGDQDLLGFIVQTVESDRIPAAKLCFEISETAMANNMTNAQSFIRKMHDLGVRFSLDGFGEGMSSFNYLKNIPIDFVKIDGSLVRDVCKDPIRSALVGSIVNIVRLMKKNTIATYVESEEVYAHVKDLGADYVQGYGVSKPQPIERILDYAKSRECDMKALKNNNPAENL